MSDLIEKLKQSCLRGRSGSSFPTGLKWEAVKNAKGDTKYVVCNGAEGEPGVFKDGYILKHYPEVVIDGIKLALEEFGAKRGYIYLRKDYFEKFGYNLRKLIGILSIEIFCETGGYLCGEETVLLNSIEGRPEQPRLKPPFSTEKGLWECPTLVNNVETFYYISKIAHDSYNKTRFVSISGDVENAGEYEIPEQESIKNVLIKTKNFPDNPFFVQVGGGASGTIFTSEELDGNISGCGAIIVYDLAKTDLKKLMKYWVEFYYNANCGKCTPCREGIYRLREMFCREDFSRNKIEEILTILREASFCALGKSLAIPMEGVLKKLWK